MADRTSQQNKAYWGVWLKAISEHTGFTENELHKLFKETFIPSYENLCTGEGEVQTTCTLSTVEFSRYLDQIHIFAGIRFNLQLPEIHRDT